MIKFVKNTAKTQDIDVMINGLLTAIKQQYENGNITVEDLQKFINLIKDSGKLRTALMYL